MITSSLNEKSQENKIILSSGDLWRLSVARASYIPEPLNHVVVAMQDGVGSQRRAQGFALSMKGLHACEVIVERSLYDTRAEVWLGSVHRGRVGV